MPCFCKMLLQTLSLLCVHIGQAPAGPCPRIGAPGRNRTCKGMPLLRRVRLPVPPLAHIKNGPTQPCASMAGESATRNLWCCVASPPGVYSTTSPGIYRMHIRPTLYGRLRSYMRSFPQSAGDLADSNRPDFGTCLIKPPLPRAGLAAYIAAACTRQSMPP